jgi:hypothetical protein
MDTLSSLLYKEEELNTLVEFIEERIRYVIREEIEKKLSYIM